MILGIIVAIFCGIGIYGFYNGLLYLTYIGMILSIIEQLYGYISGQQKSLFTIWICILLSIGTLFTENNFFNSLAILLCYENVILFIAGIFMLLITINKKNIVETNTKEDIINELMKKSGLSYLICSDVYNILLYFQENNQKEAYKIINTDFVTHLINEQNKGNVGIAFGMLIGENSLTSDEANKYSINVINAIIKKMEEAK